jgi:hypothetical protein
MKNKIIFYLFIFSVLMLLFMYMNQKRIYEDQETRIEKLNEKVTFYKGINEVLTEENFELNYFTLMGNDNAMSYFESFGLEADFMQDMVTEQIYNQNNVEGDNPLVPYVGMEGTMKINKVRFLNHRWVIADFTDGRHWGEMLLEYNLDENNDLTLKTLSSLLYQGN